MGGITTAPAKTPTTKEACCRQGVAFTSWPVFKSCRLSFDMVGTEKTIAVTNNEKATRADDPAEPRSIWATNIITNEAPITAKIQTPESGLLEEPVNTAV